MKKKVFIIIISLFIIGIFICLGKYLYIMNLKSNCIYIGKEYCYTYDNNNIHHDKRYFYFYYDKEDNNFICIKNNNKIFEINSIQDLELLYITEVNCVLLDKSNASIAYDENNNEITSTVLKNKMFLNTESKYWDFNE